MAQTVTVPANTIVSMELTKEVRVCGLHMVNPPAGIGEKVVNTLGTKADS